MQPFTVNLGNLLALLPIWILIIAALLLILLDVVAPRANRLQAGFGLASVAAAALALILLFPFKPVRLVSGALLYDGFGATVGVAVLLVLALTLVFSPHYMQKMGLRGLEYYPLLFISSVGMMLLPLCRDLLSIIVSIELLSIPLYVLAGYNRRLETSKEAGFKYFILGAFASAFMIYGAAFIYGTTGTLWLSSISEALPFPENRLLLLLGLGLLLVGFAFKAAIAPFQWWVPDVYEGSPSPVTGFMAAGVKLAIFAVFLRLLIDGFMPLANDWRIALSVLAVTGMILGNLLALHQMSLKRLLAYSSITHAGYLVLGLVAANREAVSATLFYLIAYAATIVGVMALISGWAREDQDDVYMSDLRGMAASQPLAALLVTIFMLSLIGFPLTAGFIGKLMLFYAVYKAGFIALLVIAVINTMVSVYYYLRVIQAMYLVADEERAADGARQPVALAPVYALVGGVSVLIVLFLGIVPRWLLTLLNFYRFGG
jgi:NADH-quinone oxidoreductase subunit N